MSALDEILIAFGGNATLLIVLGFLARSLIQTWLAKDIKKFEADLQNTATAQLERLKYDLKSQGDASIEHLKNRLQQATIEHQVRFARLHEKRAEVIWELYASVQDAWLVSERFIRFDGYKADKEKQQETYPQINRMFLELLSAVERNRICLPEVLCASLENAVIAVRKIVVGVECYGSAAQTVEQKQQVLTDAMEAFDRDVPAAKKALVDEFRRILGVENG
jgi:hypothetical protein